MYHGIKTLNMFTKYETLSECFLLLFFFVVGFFFFFFFFFFGGGVMNSFAYAHFIFILFCACI